MSGLVRICFHDIAQLNLFFFFIYSKLLSLEQLKMDISVSKQKRRGKLYSSFSRTSLKWLEQNKNKGNPLLYVD